MISMMETGTILILLVLCLVELCHNADFTTCARDKSRLVRKHIEKEIMPLYQKYGASVPTKCDFNSNRDMYLEQELHKFEEGSSKWVCQYCGKAFYDQRYLDNHFINRHSEFIKQGPQVVCLADLCDVFRCDVILHKNEPKYWDRALCREKQIEEYRNQCYDLVKTCVPDSLKPLDRLTFYEKLNGTLCSYLTCAEYWTVPNMEMHPVSLALYIVVTSMLVFGLLIYYYVAYTHFYTDESLLDETRENKYYNENPQQYYAPPYHQVRQRSAIPGIRR